MWAMEHWAGFGATATSMLLPYLPGPAVRSQSAKPAPPTSSCAYSIHRRTPDTLLRRSAMPNALRVRLGATTMLIKRICSQLAGGCSSHVMGAVRCKKLTANRF